MFFGMTDEQYETKFYNNDKFIQFNELQKIEIENFLC